MRVQAFAERNARGGYRGSTIGIGERDAMAKTEASRARGTVGVIKVPTGIRGLDEITDGGLPRAAPTLVCGGPGCGKTLLGDGVPRARARPSSVSRASSCRSRRRPSELEQNVASLGFDLDDARCAEELVSLDYVRIERSEIEETGEYDLEGLFVRLGYAIDSISAKRVVLDTRRGAVRRAVRTSSSCALRCGGCSAGSRTGASPRSSPASVARARSRATGSRSTSPTACILLDHRVERPARHAPAADRQVPRLRPRHQRVPVHHHKAGISVLPMTSMGLEHAASTRRHLQRC